MAVEPDVGQGALCPHCGALNERPRRYCGDCGGDLQRAATETPERRHLTVMFCDLVGSTALSERLDPEEFGEVILAYREVVSEAAKRFAGYIARYVGDGVLAYFGYPRAHGDDPQRALHAALQVASGVAALSKKFRSRDIEVHVRIGVHTGLVMVGDLAGGGTREQAGVVGETPNLAARLMSMAAPDTVIVSGVTHDLTRGQFEFESLGPAQLQGLSRPVPTYRLTAARPFDGALAFTHGFHMTPIVNRVEELGFLRERWANALEGRGSVVEVVGEAGIGKSRLLHAFADHLGRSPHHTLALQCSPYFSNSALYPVVSFLNGWLEDVGGDKLQFIARAARELGIGGEEAVPAMAGLLSIPLTAQFHRPEQSSRMRRETTMALLREWLLRLSVQNPTLIVVEDFQWADASSIELVDLLLERIASARILLVLSRRTDSPPSGLPNLETLKVERLSPAHVQEMIALVSSSNRLPASVCERVARKSDGVPLFIEELTKTMLGADPGTAEADAADVEIPLSLHATLMARLDKLNAAKALAQRASVLGREFSYELIAAATEMRGDELDRALDQLVQAELLYQRGTPPVAMYAFKHGLIQETAYRSLLRVHRRRYHLRVAEVLVAQFGEVAANHPELVAHHFSQAHEGLPAARYWRKAGEHALARSANAEACAHIRKGLEELSGYPESSDRLHEEVMLLLGFGAALSALKGSAAPEVEQTYARARELCAGIDDPAYLFPVLRGLHSFYLVRGPLRTAYRMIEQLREMAERGSDPLQRVEARRRHGWCLFCMGRIQPGRDSLVKALADYDASQSSQHIVTYGSDPAIIGYVNLAWLEWFAGDEAAALDYSTRAVEHARRLSYGLGMAYALGMSAALYQCMGDAARTAQLAAQTIDLANKQGFPYWVAWETALLGWARAADGDVDGGIALLKAGLQAYRDTGSELFAPHMLGLLAEASLRAGRHDAALEFCEEALASSERSDAHFYDAEIHRLEAEAIWTRDGDRASARAAFHEALNVARAQGARMLESRIVRSLEEVGTDRG